MKRLLIALSVTVGLTVAALPASAATVDGFNYGEDGLQYLSESCAGVLDAPSVQAAALYRTGGDSGTHATGYSVSNSANLFGAETYVSTPSTLQSISFGTYHPEGPDANADADGYFRAIYDQPGDGFHVGYKPLDVVTAGWGTWSNYATAQLTWYSVPGTVENPGTPVPAGLLSYSIKAVPAQVGAGGGAYVGFGFGCNGRDFYLDDFRVRTSTRNSVYDFEGMRSRSYISSNPNHRSTQLLEDITSLRLIKGQNHYLLGHSYGLPDEVEAGGYLTGAASLYAKSYGSSTWRRVSSDNYYPNYAVFRIKPSRRTQYQIRTAPSTDYRDRWENSTSKTLTVSVERRMKARADSKVVRKGQSVHVTGQVFPKDKGVKVTLQRKVGNKWRKIGKAKTRKKGKYSVSGRATSTGKWQVRIKVAKAKGNLGNVSPSIRIAVKKPKKKPAPVRPVSVENPTSDVDFPNDEGIEGRRPGRPTRALPLGPVPTMSNGGVVKSPTGVATAGRVATQR